jgi:hypothetical protein
VTAALYTFRDTLKDVLAAVESAIRILEEGAVKPVHGATADAPRADGKPSAASGEQKAAAKPGAPPRNPANVWDDWQIIKMVKMKEEGAASSAIGQAVGKTPVQVNNKWAQHQARINKAAAGERKAPPQADGGAAGRTGRGRNRRRTT